MSEYVSEENVGEETGGGSWLVYIGLLLLVNFLSYVFDWPFWVY